MLRDAYDPEVIPPLIQQRPILMFSSTAFLYQRLPVFLVVL